MTTVTSATAGSTTPAVNTGVGNYTSSAVADYDDFLTLLTTQMQNQDPLEPTDSTEWIAQLATFTSVEEAMETNDKLASIAELLTGDDMSLYASWIGRTVTSPYAGQTFDGSSLDISAPGDENAESAKVLIRDKNGDTVATMPFSTAGSELTWTGTLDDGGQAEAGLYYVDFEYTATNDKGDDESWTVVTEGVGKVVEVRATQSGVELYLDNGSIIDPSGITAIADSSATPSADTADDS